MNPNSAFRILVVEDERDIRELVLLHLKREGYVVDSAENGEEGLRLLGMNRYQVAVIDWMLPGISGIDLCKRLRSQSRIPLLMLTARTDPADIVLGLEAGADDYVTKPFDVPVFLARIRALLRRGEAPTAESSQIKIGALVVDLEGHQVSCGGESLQLTPSEFKLLAALAQNQGRVFSRERLIDLVQGAGVAVVDRTIDTHIFGLRKKLGSCSEVIETIRGVGYRVRSE
jgi:DNA-binding response OmpR family regulator